jgi:hypothetical protein
MRVMRLVAANPPTPWHRRRSATLSNSATERGHPPHFICPLLQIFGQVLVADDEANQHLTHFWRLGSCAPVVVRTVAVFVDRL